MRICVKTYSHIFCYILQKKIVCDNITVYTGGIYMIKRMAVRCLLVAVVILLLAIPAVATEEALPETHNHSVTTWTSAENDHSGVCADCGETVSEGDEGELMFACRMTLEQ